MEEIVNICYEVEEMGKGYSECVYQEAICVLLRERGINYAKEVVRDIKFRERYIGFMRMDIVLDDIIIECKAIDGNLKTGHVPQLITYLEMLNMSGGILVNFNQNPGKELVEVVVVNKDDDKYSVKIRDDVVIFDRKGCVIVDK